MNRARDRQGLDIPTRLVLVENDVDDIHSDIVEIKASVSATNKKIEDVNKTLTDKIGRTNTLLTSILVTLVTILGGGLVTLIAVR